MQLCFMATLDGVLRRLSINHQLNFVLIDINHLCLYKPLYSFQFNLFMQVNSKFKRNETVGHKNY